VLREECDFTKRAREDAMKKVTFASRPEEEGELS
jgi:hypothetical protein